MAAQIDIADLSSLLAARMPEVVDRLGLAGERAGSEFVALNPRRKDTRLGSFSIKIIGAKAGVWKDWATGDGGDALDLVAFALGMDLKAARGWALRFLGLPAGDLQGRDLQRVKRDAAAYRQRRDRDRRAEDVKRRRQAKAIFLAADADIAGTPVELYLRSRVIDPRRLPRYPRALRFAPALYCAERGRQGLEPRAPAMVAPIVRRGDDGKYEIVAVHRTYLAPRHDGVWGKAPLDNPKMTLGRYEGGVISLWAGERVTRDGEVVQGKSLGAAEGGVVICEGIEDGLTLALAAPERRILCAVSLGNLANVILPPAVTEVILALDNDTHSSAVAARERAIAALQSQGRRVLLARPPGGKDMNDTLRHGTAAAISEKERA